MEFFTWLENTGLATQVRESLWMYPTVLTFHALGMAIVVGLMLMIDIRVLGFAKGIPMTALDRLFTVAWIGFGINLISGLSLFTADAARFMTSAPFLIKMSALILGGIATLIMTRQIYGSKSARKSEPSINGTAKGIAVVAIILWLTAITAGRMTAYL